MPHAACSIRVSMLERLTLGMCTAFNATALTATALDFTTLVFTGPRRCKVYILLEYCNCGDLAALLKQHRMLPEPHTVAYLRQLASVLQYVLRLSASSRPADLQQAACRPGKGNCGLLCRTELHHTHIHTTAWCNCAQYCPSHSGCCAPMWPVRMLWCRVPTVNKQLT